MKIKINGADWGCCFSGVAKRLDYDDVISMSEKSAGATVTYSNGVGGAQGELIKGQSVDVCAGMVFNCVHTDNA